MLAPMVDDKKMDHNPVTQRKAAGSAFSYMHIETEGRVNLDTS